MNYVKQRSIVKYPGGKSRLAKLIVSKFPKEFGKYHEPFMGSAAVFLAQETPHESFLYDKNQSLITTFRVVKYKSASLIDVFDTSEIGFDNTAETYYKIRNRFNENNYADPIFKAADYLYLNRVCFNGLQRTNKNGKFNVPFGKYTNPTICNAGLIRQVAAKLTNALVEEMDILVNTHWMSRVDTGDLVYLDPPYHMVKAGSFTSFAGAFGEDEHIKLANACHKLNNWGVKFILSNSNTWFVNNLYKDFKIEEIEAPRSISGSTKFRKTASELLISNY